jgi:hypothetical protein
MPNILLVQSGRLGDGKTFSGIPRHSHKNALRKQCVSTNAER